MLRLLRHAFALLALLVAVTGSAGPAFAHPHVFVTSSSELVYGPDGAMTGVRHAWTFDDMFSTYAVQGIETRKKGVYTREDLAPLAQTNVESLKEFNFFTFARSGDGGPTRKQKFSDPVDYWLEHKDGALVLHFTLPFITPVKSKTLALEVFDPAYFINFVLEDKDPVKLVGAPAGCTMKIQRPNDGSGQTRPLDESSFASGDNSNYGAMFANKITVDCP